jgi:UDP-N-acetyl-D-mannosaminuronic acid dehydrogenase
VNLAKTAHVIGAAEMLVSQHPKARVACLGLAFKPNIDDFRESPAVEVAAALARRFGKQIEIVEPYARGLPMEFAGTSAELIDLDSALAGCDVLIVLVDHDLFKSIPIEERGDKIVYDTRGLWLDQPSSGNGNRLHRAA